MHRYENNLQKIITVGVRPTAELLSLPTKESNQRNWPSEIFIRLFAQLKESNITCLPAGRLAPITSGLRQDITLLHFSFLPAGRQVHSSPKISKGTQVKICHSGLDPESRVFSST
jgi:hypothetical protein